MTEARLEASFSGAVGGFTLDATLSVPASGVTALFGPSASGKTTLLRCIAGLTRLPGRLSFAGETWQDETRFVAPHKRGVGYVFQEPSLFSHLTVRGNLAYGAKRRPGGIRFDEVVALLSLEPLLARSTPALSGGERQRVAIGRALLGQPRLLLMDEPLASLDRDARADILPRLERLHRAAAIPIVYVTHDPTEIARLADRVLLIQAGKIVGAPLSPAAPQRPEPEARAALAATDEDRTARLALSALMAGLEPFGERASD